MSVMKKVKITINSDDRVVVIPMEYDTTSDSLNFSEIQIEPIPSDSEDVSKDVVMQLTMLIMSILQNK